MSKERASLGAFVYWCPTCGIVWAASEPPICRHMVIDGPAARRMEPLPSWHPFAEVAA